MKFWLRRYFSILYLLATLLGVLHHHDDLKQHSDCKICLVKSTLSHADTPDTTPVLAPVDLLSAPVPDTLSVAVIARIPASLQARAPPKFS